MSFFVKCPKQRPVQGRFKKVQTCPPSGRRVYGAIEDKGTLPFGLESFDLEAIRLRAHGRGALDRLRAERLLHHFETTHSCACIGHYKKRHTYAPQTVWRL
jgi:hypothetical protein